MCVCLSVCVCLSCSAVAFLTCCHWFHILFGYHNDSILGSIWECLGIDFGGFWGSRGRCYLEVVFCSLILSSWIPSWRKDGPSWSHLEASLGPDWAICGLFKIILGYLWAISILRLSRSIFKQFGPSCTITRSSSVESIFGHDRVRPSWSRLDHPGLSLGHLYIVAASVHLKAT